MTHDAPGGPTLEVICLVLAAAAVFVYAVGVRAAAARGRDWPRHRLVLWAGGIALATVTVVGPLPVAAHDDFVAHMTAHLLGGMLAPILLVRAAPVTLALRALHPDPARRLSRILRTAPARFVAHPITAAILSAGGLWLLYLTPLFAAMRGVPLMHVVVHAHLLVAGYLFTAAVVGLDPSPHPARRPLVAAVLVVSLASHSILAKVLVVRPPAGVDAAEALRGAEFMYYAGAWVEAVIIVLFCAEWYRAAGRDRARGAALTPARR